MCRKLDILNNIEQEACRSNADLETLLQTAIRVGQDLSKEKEWLIHDIKVCRNELEEYENVLGKTFLSAAMWLARKMK